MTRITKNQISIKFVAFIFNISVLYMFTRDRVHVCTPYMHKSPWKSKEVVRYPGTYNCELKWMLGTESGSFTLSNSALYFRNQISSYFQVLRCFIGATFNLLSGAFRSNLI